MLTHSVSPHIRAAHETLLLAWCCHGGDGAGGDAGAAGGDGAGPALVLACNCMEDAAGAARLEEALQALLTMLGSLASVPLLLACCYVLVPVASIVTLLKAVWAL